LSNYFTMFVCLEMLMVVFPQIDYPEINPSLCNYQQPALSLNHPNFPTRSAGGGGSILNTAKAQPQSIKANSAEQSPTTTTTNIHHTISSHQLPHHMRGDTNPLNHSLLPHRHSVSGSHLSSGMDHPQRHIYDDTAVSDLVHSYSTFSSILLVFSSSS
jgi:hypothetical protein